MTGKIAKYLLFLLIFTVAVGVIYLAGNIFFVWKVVNLEKIPVNSSPEDIFLQYEEIEFVSSSGPGRDAGALPYSRRLGHVWLDEQVWFAPRETGRPARYCGSAGGAGGARPRPGQPARQKAAGFSVYPTFSPRVCRRGTLALARGMLRLPLRTQYSLQVGNPSINVLSPSQDLPSSVTVSSSLPIVRLPIEELS